MSILRIHMAGLFHESHSFLDQHTPYSEFQTAGYGSDRPLAIEGSPMEAAHRSAQAEGCRITSGPYFYAMPSGAVEDDVVNRWKRFFEASWLELETKPDGIFLVLHGAMLTGKDPEVEANLIHWVRSLPGAKEIPIHAVLDLHGNISSSLAQGLNCHVAYQKNPHTDARDAAVGSMTLLLRSLRSGRPLRTHWLGTDLILPPSSTGTDAAPMRELEEMARDYEKREGVHVVNVFAGYSYADAPSTGVTFTLVSDPEIEREQALPLLENLRAVAMENRAAATPTLHSEEDLLRAMQNRSGGPVVVAEPADNIGAGAPGDCTGLLRIFLKHQLENAAIILNDPATVSLLDQSNPTGPISVSLGGKESSLDVGPIEAEITLLRCFDGAFDLEDPHSHLASMSGVRTDMGRCALVRLNEVTILLTSIKTPPFDLGQWRIAGVSPESFAVIGVKAAVAHRQAYNPIASNHLTMETPGPCATNLQTLPFQRVRRPVIPLDPFS